MMAGICVNLYEIREANYRIPITEEKVENVHCLVRRLHSQIAEEIACRHQIGKRMNEIYRDIYKVRERIEEIYQVTNDCVEQYASTEQENTRNAEAFY